MIKGGEKSRAVVSFAQIFEMVRPLFIVFAFILVVSCNESSKPEPAQVTKSKHGEAFNRAVDKALQDYYVLSETFVRWDSAKVLSDANRLDSAIKNIKTGETSLDAESAKQANLQLFRMQDALLSLTGNKNLTGRRRDFETLSESFYGFLNAVRYDNKKLYLQECPMAFNDEETAVWLTEKGVDSIRNPYLGLYHPKYKDGMLECGSNKATLDFQNK